MISARGLKLLNRPHDARCIFVASIIHDPREHAVPASSGRISGRKDRKYDRRDRKTLMNNGGKWATWKRLSLFRHARVALLSASKARFYVLPIIEKLTCITRTGINLELYVHSFYPFPFLFTGRTKGGHPLWRYTGPDNDRRLPSDNHPRGGWYRAR